MLLGKICKYYQDSKCLYKHTYCDPFCDQMKYSGKDEFESLVKETYSQEKRNVTRSPKKDLVPFL